MTVQSSNRLQEIFRVVFELPESADVRELSQTTAPRWESLDHVTLVAAIESEFGVTLDALDQLRMHSYAATCALLEEKGCE